MLKVECESCRAPYHIDERRVPSAGLKMRCPKCGHSFLVASPGAAPPSPGPPGVGLAAKAPARVANKTIHGVAPPGVARPQPAPAIAKPASFPSDFPAALGSLEETDLPVVSPDLPVVTRPGRSIDPAAPPFGNAHSDLPAIAADLPSLSAAKGKPPPPKPAPRGAPDLPQLRADLPARPVGLPAGPVHRPSPEAGLPVVMAPSLPMPAAGLPSRAASLPATAASLPTARAPGGIDLPVPAASLPVVTPTESHLPVVAPPVDLGAFGEIDLPREPPPSSSSRHAAPKVLPKDSADFGDLQLESGAGSGGSERPPAHAGGDAGGMAFGEVDLGGEPSGSITSDRAAPLPGVNASASIPPPPALPGPTSWAPPPAQPASLRPLPRDSVRTGARKAAAPANQRRTVAKAVALGLGVVLVTGGAALQLTPYGAYGYLVISDVARAGDYARATSAAIHAAQAALGPDTYDVAKTAVDAIFAAQARAGRDRPLAAYAAFVGYATTLRFGPDSARGSSARQVLSELPAGAEVQYRDLALAAQVAAGGELDTARKALDAAARRVGADPVRLDVSLLRGDLALASSDAPAAVAAFKEALALSNDARAHFGLARAYDALGDPVNASKEVEATLVASPQHPGALTLRARRKNASGEAAAALADLAGVLDASRRAKASPHELSDAYAARAWVLLDRGGGSDAREAFAEAVKLNPGNGDALSGEGRLLFNEGRYAEALARFDAALKVSPGSAVAIASDAEAKIALERLDDAKQQLLAARARYPKSIPILLSLANVEHHLGNNDAAEADLRAAIAAIDATRSDAVLPYVAMCELQSALGRLSDAKATLEDAKRALPPSPGLERAFGAFEEFQGNLDRAIAHYRAAVNLDSRDAAAHFRLASALRRMRRFQEAGAELDRVAEVDRDYPGLLLERGLLFEDSGDVEKAIEQFKSALARAPDDPDLQLRVGAAYVAIGRADDALPILHKVLDKRPNSAEANHYLGRALMLKGGPLQADALRYLKRAVEIDGHRAEFHVYLAWAANDATPAQLEVARDEIERALVLDKLSAEAYWQRGVLERMQGAIEDAMKDEKHALELRPSRYEAHATLAECYEDKNDTVAALAEWPRALAGAASETVPEGTVAHPYWLYRYGKLLMESGNRAGALAQLLPALATVERADVKPAWLAPLEFLSAEALRGAGRHADALEHYRRFLEIAPINSPDRYDAQKAIAALTGGR